MIKHEIYYCGKISTDIAISWTVTLPYRLHNGDIISSIFLGEIKLSGCVFQNDRNNINSGLEFWEKYCFHDGNEYFIVDSIEINKDCINVDIIELE
jgi:hypothetical protein